MDDIAKLNARLQRVAGVLKKLADEGSILDQERGFREDAKANDSAITTAVMALDTAGQLAHSMFQAYGMLKEVDALYTAVFDADKQLQEHARKTKSRAYFPVHATYKKQDVTKPSGVKNKAAARRVKKQVPDVQSDLVEVTALHNDALSPIASSVSSAIDAAVSALPEA